MKKNIRILFNEKMKALKLKILLLRSGEAPVMTTARAQRNMDTRVALAVEDWIARGHHLLPMTTMDEVADDMGICKDQLSRFFQIYHTQNFLSWRKEQRIAEAKALLLENPKMTLNELSVWVGIEDRSNMRRQFHEVTGYSPAEWVKMNVH